MANPSDHARDVSPPIGGVSYQLLLGGAPWMRIGQELAGQVVLGAPVAAQQDLMV